VLAGDATVSLFVTSLTALAMNASWPRLTEVESLAPAFDKARWRIEYES
jgi:hypothetical protein